MSRSLGPLFIMAIVARIERAYNEMDMMSV